MLVCLTLGRDYPWQFLHAVPVRSALFYFFWHFYTSKTLNMHAASGSFIFELPQIYSNMSRFTHTAPIPCLSKVYPCCGNLKQVFKTLSNRFSNDRVKYIRKVSINHLIYSNLQKSCFALQHWQLYFIMNAPVRVYFLDL